MQEKPMPATGNVQAPPGLAKITSKYNGKGHAACHQIGEKPLTGDVTSARGQTTFGCALPKGTIVVTTWLGPHFQQGTPQTVVFLLYSMHSIDSSVYSWSMRIGLSRKFGFRVNSKMIYRNDRFLWDYRDQACNKFCTNNSCTLKVLCAIIVATTGDCSVLQAKFHPPCLQGFNIQAGL
jgi:hypothetical protein